MRANRDLTPDRIYWPNVIKPIIGVDRDAGVEMHMDDQPDFSEVLRRALEDDGDESPEARARRLKIGYAH